MRISHASLRILAAYTDALAPHGSIGRWRGGEADSAGAIQMPWYEYLPEIDRFVADMYAAKLVRPVDWVQWSGTPEATLLLSDPTTIESASQDELVYLLTTIVRGERFSEGEIADAYERGTLHAIAVRAQALLDGLSGGGR